MIMPAEKQTSKREKESAVQPTSEATKTSLCTLSWDSIATILHPLFARQGRRAKPVDGSRLKFIILLNYF
ncbi:MAG: hypothetical protein ACQEP7_01020 [bacterium]